ncbi:MAG: proteasome protein [Nostoc sp. EkiNYC01]|nr:proteasome protein [Nostoc sp. EkiNYC01]
MKQEKILIWKEYAESIRQKVDLVLNNSSFKSSSQASWFHPDLPQVLTSLDAAAQKTIENASSPVKIGIMGEFNAGKTLLIGSLIGYADALPVSANPTTGNVTAIHLVPQDDLQTTQISAFTVEYLDELGVKECLRYMLDEAAKRTLAAGLSLGETLKNLNLNNDGFIESITNWSQQAWNASNNPDLRYLIRELIIFINTYKAYKTAICNNSYTIDATTAEEGLKLTPPPKDIQNLKFVEIIPTTLVAIEKSPQQLTSQLLQRSFSLIHRIQIEVGISKEIWNLSPLQGVNEFILLDFPGLGAANSGVRDSFLSLNELKKVQTILILLNGESPGNDRAGKIFTMLQQQKQGQNIKDRIIVGVGRFDKLPLKDDGEDLVLQELIKNSASPWEEDLEDPLIGSESRGEQLDEQKVLEKLKILNTTIATAQAFTSRQDRILLLSPLLGLAELKKRSRTIQIGSQQFLVKLETPGFLDEAERMRSYWEKLSEKLLESNSRSELGKQLSYFADDGSIGKLRELLQKHVEEYGFQQVYEDTERCYQSLKQELKKLENILNEIKDQGIPVEENPNVANLRQIVETLYNIYNDFRRDLDKEPLKDRSQVPLSDVVYQELTFKMFDWPEWNSLFQRSQKGIITLPEKDALDDAIFGLDTQSSNDIPTKSDDFYTSFEKTIQELEIFARTLSRQAVADLLNSLSAKVSVHKEELSKIIPRDKLQERTNKLREKYNNARALQILSGTAVNPHLLQDYIFKKCNLQPEANTTYTTKPENIFPLARSVNNKNGQNFDWGNNLQRRYQSNQDTPKPANHEILVLRLRDEMIACAGLRLVELVSEVNQHLNNTLGELLNNLINELQALLRNEALLRDIATEDSQGSGEVPTWLQILDNITSNPEPDII